MSLLFRAALAAVAFGSSLALAPAAGAAPVPGDAGKAVTFPFPANAPVAVQVTGVGAARERLSAMLKAALPDEAKELDKQIDEALKQVLADRKLTAVPKDGRVFVVVNDIASLFEGEPAFAVLVPVSSYKEFKATFLTADERKTLGEGKGVDEVKLSLMGAEHTVHMVDLKEYVAVTPDKGTADLYAGKFARATTAAMPAELARSFVGSDLAVYLNADAINNKYAEQIKGFKMLIDFGLQQAEMGGMLPGINKKQLAAAKVMLGGAFQALEDCRGVVLGAEFRPEGLNLRLQAQFADDTASAAVLKAERPGALADIGKLPAGLGQYAGTKFGKKFHDMMKGLNPEFAPADDDENGNAALEKHLTALHAAGPQGEVSGSGGAGANFTAAKYTDAKKAVAALTGCYEAMAAGGRLHSAVLKGAPKITKDARKHGAFTFTEVRVAFDFEATVKDLPEGLKENTIAQLKRALTEQMTLWIGTDGQTVIQVTAKDFDAAAAAVDAFLDPKKPVGETDGFKLTRKQLPADANALVLAETGQLVTVLLDSLKAMQDTVPGFPRLGKVQPLKGEPTFIGIAVTLKDAATLNVFIPGEALAAGKKIVTRLLTNVE
ncbi:hypothetical protein R5W23_006338 [Gemmata sp. JC673]|uniref:DUF3352 domain-containing protein n=1 Tax=Gemmata algarum TaxID=2975278 RepID=A0ABU5EVB9_9BACT|nr:hypothetical protein [Gemmata algarum]MDY3559135.1 hypothetical protein [Gemmata algarum]